MFGVMDWLCNAERHILCDRVTMVFQQFFVFVMHSSFYNIAPTGEGPSCVNLQEVFQAVMRAFIIAVQTEIEE